MRTKEEIEHFKGFCEIVGDDFPITMLDLFSTSSKIQLDSFKTCLLASLKNRKSCMIVDGTKEYKVKITQIPVALNILDWMEQ